jgi:TATA-binding protein-associated factor Taf7
MAPSGWPLFNTINNLSNRQKLSAASGVNTQQGAAIKISYGESNEEDFDIGDYIPSGRRSRNGADRGRQEHAEPATAASGKDQNAEYRENENQDQERPQRREEGKEEFLCRHHKQQFRRHHSASEITSWKFLFKAAWREPLFSSHWAAGGEVI